MLTHSPLVNSTGRGSPRLQKLLCTGNNIRGESVPMTGVVALSNKRT
jgi:hypothetical protein